MRQARDQAVSNGIGRVSGNDWNCGGRLLQHAERTRHPGDDDIDLQSYELCRQIG